MLLLGGVLTSCSVLQGVTSRYEFVLAGPIADQFGASRVKACSCAPALMGPHPTGLTDTESGTGSEQSL